MFTDCYCTQFRRASASLTRIYDAALQPAGLKITQFSVLRGLGRLGEATSTQLADEVALDRTTISRGLKFLITSGWVVARDAEDRREKVLMLTRAGQKAIAKALPYFAEAQKIVEARTRKFTGAPRSSRLLEALVDLQDDVIDELAHSQA